MKIYYDFQTLLNQRFGGISRYFFEIISRLKELSDLNINIQCFHSRNYYFKNQFRMVNIHNRIINGIDYRFASFVNKLIALHEIKLKNYDIIHPTYYNPYILKSPVKESCLIVTVHDMIHEKYIKQYPQLGTRDIEHKRIMVNAADWIIAVSECTKQDLLYYYPHLKEERISVIYHGSSYNPKVFNTHKLGGGTHLTDTPYILFVGNRGAYKNFMRFCKAMQLVLKHYTEYHVVCAGGGSFTAREIETIGSNINKFHQLNLDDKQLAEVYRCAQCFVFPSEYEGFGIPILEAFANKCPAVLSNTSSLPEVALGAAEYFDPLNFEDMADKICFVLENAELREKLKTRGLERLKDFSWDKAADETLKSYENARKDV